MNTHDFTVLHNRLYGKLFSFVHLRIKDTEEVKDIVQDIFLKALNSWEEVPDEQTARNYLYLIARQRMIDLWRSGRSKYKGELLNTNNSDGVNSGESDFDLLAGDMPLPEDIFEENEKKQQVMELLNSVKESERELLVLRYLEEMEYSELSKIYKTSEDNIRQRVSRALQNLRKKVEKK